MDTSAELEPIRNWTWEALDEADQTALREHFVFRHLPPGDVLIKAGEDVDLIYFPVTAYIANVVRLSGGGVGMATCVGRDSLTGLAAFLADEPLGWDVDVQLGGSAWVIAADVLRRRTAASPALLNLLVRLTHKNQIEAARNAVCALNHMLTPRLARWLLITQDRTGASEFKLRQEDLAKLLGVQRTTVVEAFQTLTKQGATSSRRGRVKILDRASLKLTACECYAGSANGKAP